MQTDKAEKPVNSEDLSEIPICAMDAGKCLLQSANGRVFREVATNIWMDDGSQESIAYLGTGKHGGGIILRPLFVKTGSAWVNATTGKEAPPNLAEALDNHNVTQNPSKSDDKHDTDDPDNPDDSDNRGKENSPDNPNNPNNINRTNNTGNPIAPNDSPNDSSAPNKSAGAERGNEPSIPNVPERVLARLSWEKRCEGLTRIAEAFDWSEQLRDIYQRLCEVVADLFSCNQTHMHLISVDGQRFVRRSYCADVTSGIQRDDSLPLSVGRILWMMENRCPTIMDYECPHTEDEIPREAFDAGFVSAVSIPLLADEVCLGMISLVYRRKTTWTEEDCSYLVLVGRTIGALIKRLSDTKKAAELQILNERKLLSTEIHENVSSLLGAVSINATAALTALEENNEDLAKEDLKRLETTAAETMRILRDEMFSLRINLENTDTLIEGMQECLEKFETNWGIKTSLSITGSHLPVIVPTQVSLQLTRILNECLSNTLRHSGATGVNVEVASEEHSFSLTVSDNGHGFDVNAVDSDHFGLKIMRERALATGGRFFINSTGEGTIVRVEVEKRKAARVGNASSH